MSIVDVKRQFIEASGGNPPLRKATMRYEQGGAIQVFCFDCGDNPIEVECKANEDIGGAVLEAVKIAQKRMEKDK